MTKEALELQVNRVIAAAKSTIELSADFLPQFFMHHRGYWQPFPMPPGTEHILNDGESKRILFRFFRALVKEAAADAVIFATDTWVGATTEEGMKHIDTAEWRELNSFGFDKLVQRGWVRRSEALTVTAQTETDALIVQQPYQRRSTGLELLTAKRYWVEQQFFKGRQKMFGDLKEENLGEQGW